MSNVKKKPLLAYLDYNVIVSLQDADLTIDQIKHVLGTTNVVFPFSASHVEEVKNIKDRPDISREIAIKERLKFIDAITKKQYLERIDFDIPYKKRSVSSFVVYDTISEVPGVQSYYKTFSDFVTEDQKQMFRDKLGLDTKTLNNVKPNEIIEHLNTKSLIGEHISVLEMLAMGSKCYPPTYKWGIETDIAGLFALLDIVGYWKDKYKDNSNVARFWDSSHCGFASFCDVLVSQDARMRLKSEVAYTLFNVKTKIVSPITS